MKLGGNGRRTVSLRRFLVAATHTLTRKSQATTAGFRQGQVTIETGWSQEGSAQIRKVQGSTLSKD